MSEAGRVEIETVRVGPEGVELAGFEVTGPSTARRPDGSAVHVLNPPQRRRWGEHGDLLETREVGWELAGQGDGTRLRAAEAGAEAELLRLPPDAAVAFVADDPEPLVAAPAFLPVGDVGDVGDYYVAGRILTGVGHKRRVDSTALSLYRIARRRGGPLWSGIADLVARAIAERLESAGADSLPHDLLDRGETHVRYLNDALLLMVAHAEWRRDARFERAVARAVELVGAFTVPYRGGAWVLHDSLERDDARNDAVLNTHLQAIVALRAAGADTAGHVRALAAALEPSAQGREARRAARGIAWLELARAFAPRRAFAGRAARPYAYAAEVCGAQGALRLPGGWIARDLRGERAPAYYATVNLADLGALLANDPDGDGLLRRRLDDGVRYALRSGFFRAAVRERLPLRPLIPVALRLAGRDRPARAFAQRLVRAGGAPAIGWPGYEDALWSRLVPGTP